MVYLGVGAGNHNHKFMRLKNNVIFTAAQALFDEHMFPKCPHEQKRQRQPNAPEEPQEPADQVPIPLNLPDDDDEQPRRPLRNPPKKDKGKARDVAPAPPVKPPVQRGLRRQTPSRVPSPESPNSLPDDEPGPSRPRRSERARKIPVHEGNVYGESRHPVDIFKDIEKRGSWNKIVGSSRNTSRSRTAPQSRDERVPGPSSSRSLPRSRDEPVTCPPSRWNTPREPTPMISSGSSDAEEEEDDSGSPEPIPAESVQNPHSGAPSETAEAHSEESSEENDDDEEEDGNSDDEESDESSSNEVEDALRDSQGTDEAELCPEGGARLIQHLLSRAIPPEDEGEKVSPLNVREWTFRDIVLLPKNEQKEWFNACREELEALRQRDVYDLVDRPKGRKVIKNRWVFDVKSDGRKKARLVAKGFSQVEGEDFDKIFSPVVRFETVRLILALAALEDWHISGLDVRSAYLYGKLEEEIYMEQPEGFRKPGTEHKVFKLKRALYGLKQAGLAWWRTLSESMTLMGFKRLSNDAGIYIYKRHSDGQLVVVIVYVDDALFCGKSKKLVAELKARFMKKWECRDLGDAKDFLRMQIVRKGRSIHLDRRAYLEKVLERCGMTNARPTPTPLPAG